MLEVRSHEVPFLTEGGQDRYDKVDRQAGPALRDPQRLPLPAPGPGAVEAFQAIRAAVTEVVVAQTVIQHAASRSNLARIAKSVFVKLTKIWTHGIVVACRSHQLTPETLSSGGVVLGILVFSHKNSGKSGYNCGGFAAFSFAEPSAAQDFSGNEISMADDSLQKTAKTASRAMLLPIRPLA